MIPFGFEPKTYCLEGSCSIQLSYGTGHKKRQSAVQFYCIRLTAFLLLSGRQDSNGSGRPSATLWSQTRYATYLSYFNHVGETGFEPATLWSQTRCATGLRHSPIIFSFYVKKEYFRTFGNRVEEAGFEPAVPLRVRQFSKLLVSATHPSLLRPSFLGANIAGSFSEKQTLKEKKLRQKREMPIFAQV